MPTVPIPALPHVKTDSGAVEPRPRLVMSLGDPAGIGPEVILKALHDPRVAALADWTIAGTRALLEQTYRSLQLKGCAGLAPDRLTLLEVPIGPEPITLGHSSTASGEASFRFLAAAIDRTLAGEFAGIVTAPIAKFAWKAAGHAYPGQTELLAEKTGVTEFGMLFLAQSPHSDWVLRTLLATVHIPLHQVPVALTADRMTRKLTLLLNCLDQDFGITAPRIAIAGLNPHSGEGGQLGVEERDTLLPWLHEMRQRFPAATLDGLIPPDTMWVKPAQAWYGGATAHDGYLALYHDQGLIPVKMLAFDRAVNTTIGLPFVRTSPDHGTAFDIAGQGLADPASMVAAMQWAVRLCRVDHPDADLRFSGQ
jgi:4-hydroxythreonine-4-phosphate dehydrogenase